jgi:putative NADH-flavin reductase
MNITILGATGGIGGHLLRFSLDRGHRVTALARNPNAITTHHERLRWVQGDITDDKSIGAAIPPGTDAVLSALGARGKADAHVLENGARATVAAMQRQGVRRILLISAAGFHIDRYDGWLLGFAKRHIVSRILAEPFDDAKRMEQVVVSGDLDWTIVLPPKLLDAPAPSPYRTARDHNLPRGFAISRINVADAMLTCLEDPSSIEHRIFVSR